MKTIKILFICLIATVFAHAQDVPPYVLQEAEVTPPKFTSVNYGQGQNMLNQFLSANISQRAANATQEGTEVVRFVINPSGKVSNIKIINGVSPEIDREIIYALNRTDNMWQPAYENGVAVASEKEIALAITTKQRSTKEVTEDFTKKATTYYIKASEQLLLKNQTKKALRNFEVVARYRPYDRGTLTMLALCELELGHDQSASFYAQRLEELGGIEVDSDYVTHRKNELNYSDELLQLIAAL